MSSILSFFHPFLTALGSIIAFFYGLVGDYSFSVALLTIVVYLILTPLLVKQTRSMIQMQKIQPEMKKLQQKYKGRDLESKQKMQEEMMALYKEHGVNPMGGCLSALPQFVVLGVMYYVIEGLLKVQTNNGKPVLVNGLKVAQPKYVSHSSAIYHNLVAAHGKMMSLGINLAQSPGAHHSSFAAAIPFYALLLGAIALSFAQMQQMTIRNRKIMEQTPQMKQMQRMYYVMPLVMVFIYWRLPAVLCIYFVVSSLFRIAQQELMYRFDPVLVAHVDAALAKQPGTGKKPIAYRRKKSVADAGAKDGSSASTSATPEDKVEEKQKGSVPSNGTKPAERRTTSRASSPRPQNDGEQDDPPSRPHPRSKSKRPRKAR